MMEESGIATVVVASGVFQNRMEAMRLPRTVITPHIMGRPLGRPKDRAEQRKILLAAIKLLESANHGGTILDLT
jgi:hypothetical protein